MQAKGTDNGSRNGGGAGMSGEGFGQRHDEDVIDLGRCWAVLRPNGWKIALITLAAGVAALAATFLMPDIYQATAVITPATEEKRQIPALGALASFGFDLGSAPKAEDLETLFRSKDLAVRVFGKHDYWAILYGDDYDPATGKLKATWKGILFEGEKGPRAPGDWDAIRAAKDWLKVSVNRRTGTLSVSFESTSAKDSAEILKLYLDEGKSRLQEEALDRAVKNKRFIQEQIGKTVDALTRDRLYSLYGQEVEREMMARNREQFGFRVIDFPRKPDRKSRPYRGAASVLGAFAGLFVSTIYFLKRKKTKDSGK